MIKPTGNRVAINPDPFNRERVSGLVVPDSVKRPPWTGTVIAVGPGEYNSDRGERVPIGLSPGDRVTFIRGIGFKWDGGDNGEELIILSANNILGTIE